MTESVDSATAEGVCDTCITDAVSFCCCCCCCCCCFCIIAKSSFRYVLLTRLLTDFQERSALSQLADAKKDKPKKKAASDGGVSFGVCAEQGRRPTMEDADVAFTDLAAECEGAPGNAQ